MTNIWKRDDLSEEEEKTAQEIGRKFRLSPIIGKILVRRGITTPEDIHAFLKPSLDQLHDPFLLKDMDVAIRRLNRALKAKEKIVIYGDYDVDGTTAVTLVYKYLRIVGCSPSQLDYYIPDRNDDGYGVTNRGIDYAHRFGAKLVIVLDCGVKAFDEVAYAQGLGIDMIICDHHNPASRLPEAIAVLNPKRTDNTYPNEELSGCGVGYKLMQALAISNGFPLDSLHRNLDLLAVSIASDIVSVRGENRILAYYGLKQLNSNPSFGLKSIIQAAGLCEKKIVMSDIVFKIGPRINASGRMMNGKEAVDLLLSTDEEEAHQKMLRIDEYNIQRRVLDKEITEEAISILENGGFNESDRIIVLYQPDWHKGVIGIVASRIAEMYARPTIILTGASEQISGSARSTGAFDMYQALRACKDLLLSFGGHTYAAGLTIASYNLKEFRQRIVQEAQLQNTSQEAPIESTIEIDAEIDIHSVSKTFYDSLCLLSPFGVDNPLPTFVSRNIKDAGSSRRVGHSGQHLKIDVAPIHKKRRPLSGFGFNLGDEIDKITQSSSFSMVYSVEESLFNGGRSIQLSIKDIAPSDTLSEKWSTPADKDPEA